MKITADVSKILKNVQRDFTFIFDALAKSFIDFVLFLVVLAVENFSFTRNCFYRKRGFVTMRNYVKTFRDSLGHHLA